MLGLLLFSIKEMVISKKTGEPSFVLGYRLVYLTSGSMEPTIKTNGMALTQRVDTINDIKVGDIISFEVIQDDGTAARATHRIYEINDSVIYTKGDNNLVIDSYPVSISDVESKVVLIFNFTAHIVDIWQRSTAGKVLLCCTVLFPLFLIIAIKNIRRKEEFEDE